MGALREGDAASPFPDRWRFERPFLKQYAVQAHQLGLGIVVGGQMRLHTLPDVARQIFGRGIDAVKGRGFVEQAVIQGVEHGLEALFQHLEVQQHFCASGKLAALNGKLHGKVVAVHAFAFAFIVAQGMPGGKIISHSETPEFF